VVTLTQLLTQMLEDLDAALAADQNYLLGHWIADAASWGTNANDTALWVFNARNQVTLWGPHGEISDYAAKNGWSGLVKGYYLQRWSYLFEAMVTAVQTNSPLNNTFVDTMVYAFELDYSNRTDERPPTTASGADPLVLAQQSLAKYASIDESAWTVLADTDVALPPRPPHPNFTQVGPVGYAAVGDDCPFTGTGDGSSLDNCTLSCFDVNGDSSICNLVNFDKEGGNCVYRLCVDPLHPQLSPGYSDYVTYGERLPPSPLIFAAWHVDVGVVGALCAADPTGCAAFSSDGVLYSSASKLVHAPGVTLYLPKH
jgi:hypothetical protein